MIVTDVLQVMLDPLERPETPPWVRTRPPRRSRSPTSRRRSKSQLFFLLISSLFFFLLQYILSWYNMKKICYKKIILSLSLSLSLLLSSLDFFTWNVLALGTTRNVRRSLFVGSFDCSSSFVVMRHCSWVCVCVCVLLPLREYYTQKKKRERENIFLWILMGSS